MTREESIDRLRKISEKTPIRTNGDDLVAITMAIKALENIGHLTDRPCDVCEFNKEHGCCKWTCVFSDKLFGGMA